ncbi:uncharacterized protein LOC130641504 isoform X2 [Hydractinia symbiolongicarpus]|nr:uncharacterized protein LOC130641504 isoform X2 [Hydractinia symbiolongicarpus]XP_057304306.1 uncharacterized protein LOC130641504 isoform X2 [Hydractinia symbiolongicarpus]
MVRGLALRSMLNIRVQNLVQHMKSPILRGLVDRSSYVRRNAVIAGVKLFHLSRETFEDLDLLPKFYEMIRDRDEQVSINALISIDEILMDSGGFKFDEKYVKYFLERLSTYNEWSQCMLLQRIVHYETEEVDEIIEYLNLLDDRLKHANKGVVMATINIFLQFTKKLDFIRNDIYKRIKDPMLSMLSSPSFEIVYAILNHISVLTALKARLFHEDYKYFFLRNNEPTYVRHKKLEVLTEIVTEGNLESIIEELREYVHDADLVISCTAIKCIGKIALNHQISVDVCVNTLIDILHLEVDYLTANCLEILQELMIKDNSVAMQVLPELNSCWEQVGDHALGKAAIIWIYGEYGEDISFSPYHLEELVDRIEEEHSPVVKLNLLTAMMKLFFKRPPECQNALGNLLQYCIDKENNMDIRDRALFYYRLLQNVQEAKTVVMSSYHTSTNPSINLKRQISNKNFRFVEFNTLSILYDQPSSFFTARGQYDVTECTKPQESPPEEDSYLNRKETSVVVGNLLDVDEGLQLDTNYRMNGTDYQLHWKSFSACTTATEDLTVPPKHEEIITVMNDAGIQLMASSPQSAPSWTFFFYAKATDKESLALVELLVLKTENRISIQIKCSDPHFLNEFTVYYKNLFVGKWIACTN